MLEGILFAIFYLAMSAFGSLGVIRFFICGQWDKDVFGVWKWRHGYDITWCELTCIIFLNLIPFAAVSGMIFWLYYDRQQKDWTPPANKPKRCSSIMKSFRWPKCSVAIKAKS